MLARMPFDEGSDAKRRIQCLFTLKAEGLSANARTSPQQQIPRRPVGSVPFDPVAGVVTDIARIDGRLDGFEKCLQRIEKRLELIEA